MDELKKMIEKYVSENNLILYDMKFVHEYGMKIFQVLLDKEPHISINELEKANEYISGLLDQIEISKDDYMLEVSSPGAEKELRDSESVLKHLNDYICINEEVYGYLKQINSTDYLVEVNQKGRIRVIQIKIDEVKKIRLAVKV